MDPLTVAVLVGLGLLILARRAQSQPQAPAPTPGQNWSSGFYPEPPAQQPSLLQTAAGVAATGVGLIKAATAIAGAASTVASALGIGGGGAAAAGEAAAAAAAAGGEAAAAGGGAAAAAGGAEVAGGTATAAAAPVAAVAVTAVAVVAVAVLFTHNIVGMFQSLFGDNTPPEPQRRAAIINYMGRLTNQGLVDLAAYGVGPAPALTNADDPAQLVAVDSWLAQATRVIKTTVGQLDLDLLARQAVLWGAGVGAPPPPTEGDRPRQLER